MNKRTTALTVALATLALIATFTLSIALPALAQTPGLQPITTANAAQLTQLASMDDHGDDINDLAFNAAGTLLATGGDDKRVMIWDVSSAAALGSRLYSFELDDDVNNVTFSPIGDTLVATGEFDEAYFWNAATGQQMSVIESRTGGGVPLGFSPDGTLFAVGDEDADINVYAVAPDGSIGDPLISLEGHDNTIEAVAFNATAMLIASVSSDDTVRLWGIGDGTVVVSADATAAPTEAEFAVEGTPLPPGFPTPTRAQIAVAEQVFENGRMLWVQPTGQIWVMVLEEEGSGTWAVYDDTFAEGDVEDDPELEAPEGMQQPTRGFGKLWRENPEIREALGWAITPEFGYVSQYEYHPGGTMDANGTFTAGPGFHVLFSLYAEAFRFDEATGTWELLVDEN